MFWLYLTQHSPYLYLPVLSLTTGYYHIGSLLMLIHDASDIPLDLLKIFMLVDWDILTVSGAHW